ncbi:MAG: MBL fold metallo-hydrolase, partial [Hyphomicrobiaceae bacterium]
MPAIRFLIGRFGDAAIVAVGLALFVPIGVTRAQAAEDRCIAVSQAPGSGGVTIHLAGHVPAQFVPPKSAGTGIRITFVGHSTFLIESRKGVKIATDYNDHVRPWEVPDIATMNHAHSSHFTDTPDPRIAHVLRGWNPNGGPVHHDLTVGDVRVRNLPTNIRSFAMGGTEEFGNSIFIFEMGALCIAHLGHLHHTLSARQLGQIGHMDVVLAPVDGSYTLDTPGM